jgi:uncharacterized cupin superfamily protein
VTQPPGIATPLHRHSREAEAFYLLDGRPRSCACPARTRSRWTSRSPGGTRSRPGTA